MWDEFLTVSNISLEGSTISRSVSLQRNELKIKKPHVRCLVRCFALRAPLEQKFLKAELVEIKLLRWKRDE